QDAVEKERVIAFVDNTPATAGAASVEYIRAKRIPVIGLDTSQQWQAEEAIFFPQAATGRAHLYAVIAGIAPRSIAQGKSHLGTLVCAEAPVCSEAADRWQEWAPQLGLTPVYKARASI